MEDEVIKFITGFVDLTEDETKIIHDLKLIRTFKKDTLLLSEGAYSKECYFIIKGCVRSYYLVDGEEISTEFYTENQSVIPIAYMRNVKSDYNIRCLEDCVIALGSSERNTILLEKVPKLTSLIMHMNTELLIENQLSLDNFKKLSPEERYLHLLESRPDIFNRVPLYHIATYLGITPVSLSRMRKRILSKE